MNDAELLQYVRSLGVKLWLDGDALRYSAPRGTLTPVLLSELKGRKEVLRAILRVEEDPSKLPPITPVPRDETLPLSFAQLRFWLVDQIETNTAAFNIPFALRLSGKLDTDALQRTFEEVLRRHESLRTTFETRDGVPRQIIHEPPHWPLHITDLSNLPPDQREAEMRRLALASAQTPFEISRGPLLRTMLIHLDRMEHVFVVNLHPIVSDGWSFRVLTRELVTLYQARLEDRPSSLPELTIQYADYAVWQRRFLVSIFERQLAYWKQQLTGVEPLDLPFNRPRPAVPARRGAMLRFRYPAKLAEALHGVVRRREGATLFMVLLAALHALLHRWTGQTQIVLSTQSAGRTRPELEDLVGFFLNMLLIHADFSSKDLRFRELIEQVRERTLGAYANHDVPFERVIEAVEKVRNARQTPLLQVMLINQNLPISSMKMPGLVMTPEYIERGTSQMELVISARWSTEGIEISAEYDTELFDEVTIRRLFRQYQMILEAITIDPNIPIAALPLLSPDERTHILRELGQSPESPPEARSVLDTFQAQVDRTPQAIAVEDGALRLTYRELDLRANRLAWGLRRRGVGIEVRVAVCLERSIDLIVAIWGILKAGGAYVLVDPGAPSDRATSVLSQSGAKVLLTNDALARHCSKSEIPRVMVDAPDKEPTRDERLPREVLPESLACVHYALDSMAPPRGVAVSHGSLSSMAVALRDRLNVGADDRVLQFASFGEDTFCDEMYPCLLSGGCLVPRSATTIDPASFLDECARSSITSVVLPTAFWHDLVAHLIESRRPISPSLRRVTIGGEAARVDRVNQWKSLAGSGVRLWNTFGVAEAAGVVTAGELSEIFPSGQRVPVGRPMAGVRVYILDSYGQLASMDTRGDLYIGGSGVARGYLASPSLTATRFVPDPFSEEPGALMYQTGEVARWLPDGRITLLGRRDNQVKVRGVRVELAEIERALSEHPSVRNATVVAQEQPGKGAQLVAYVVPSSATPPSSVDLRAFLAPRLPDAMLPAGYVFLDPHTPGGRVDRRALPAFVPEHLAGNQEDDAQLRTPVEQLVANTFAEVLQVQHVGMHDSFFALGGHSLLATQLVSRIRAAVGVNLPLRAFFDSPTVGGLAKVIEVELRRGKLVPPPLQRAPHDGDIPLSFAQQRLWFLYQLDPDGRAYHMPLALRLTGTIDVDALQRSLDEVSRRHEALRTTFDSVDGRAVQHIHPIGRFPLNIEDLSRAEDPEAEARRVAIQAHFRPFDLRQGPLFRAYLLRLGPEEHILLANMHHIIFDGWSMGVLVREIVAYYEAFRRGLSTSLPALPLRYVDYALWQQNWLSGEVLAQQVAFWRERLAGITPLELPTDRPRPTIASHRGATIPISIPVRTSDALRALARRTGTTLFMVLLAAFQALLHRLSEQDDFTVGSPIAGRTSRELEGIVGFFVNTLVLRADFSRRPTFLEFLAHVKETTLDAYAHQDLPFEKLVEELAPARDLSRQPLFQVMFALQNAPFEAVHLDGFAITPVSVELATAHFDLTLTMFEQDGEILGDLEYTTDLFDAATVERMAERLRLVLEAAIRSPEARISEWSLLTEQESRLFAQWNATEAPYPRESCIYELFESQVSRRPDESALVWGEQSLTFDALNRRANRLARHLRTLGVGPDVPVGLSCERSPEAIIGLLAILKAGGMYVPVEATLPSERRSYMIHETGLRLALVQPSLRSDWPEPETILVPLDVEASVAAGQDESDLALRAHPEQGAYIVFTSGSTGQPKGVHVPHRAVVRLASSRRHVEVQPDDVFLQYAPIAFDASTFEIWSALLNGACIAVAPSGVLSLDQLGAALEQHRVTTLWLTAPLFHQVIDTCPQILAGVRSLLAGGDALSLRHVEAARRYLPKTRIINGYGPTENTTFTTLGPVDAPLRGHTVPLGTPIDQTRVYILDDRIEPVAIGIPGELYAAGDGLARGYWARPGLTAERFLPDPFASTSGARMYRTGDRARWLEGGTIEFLGRRDHQVKIRGFRVELGEIEHGLLAHPAVREAVVVVRDEGDGDKRLIAYIVLEEPDTSPPVSVLHDDLKARLPGYMVPSAFVVLERMPLNKNGKLDRRALPEPSREHVAGSEADAAPQTPVERALADIFAEVLRLPSVSLYDDFFALGGHSLLATQLVSRVRSSLGIELPLRALFESPTISGLAGRVEVEQRKGGMVLPPIKKSGRDGDIPLSFAQQRLWFLDQLAPGSAAYHMPFALRLSGDLNVEALRKAFEALVHRHEALRTTMESVEGQARQKIHPPGRFDLPFDDLSGHGSPESRVYELGAEEILRPFDLAAGPLLRARLFRLREKEKEHILVTVMHHIVSDGWSLGIVMRELLAHYEAACAGRAAILPPLSVQYADYAIWQRSWLSGEVLEKQLAYWSEKLSGVAPLELPTDRPRPPQPSHRGGSVRVSLGKSLTEALQALARRQGVTLFMVLLAGFQALLHRSSGQTDIAVGTPIAGRTQKELEGLIGFFVNTLVLRTDFTSGPSFWDLLAQVKETTLDAYAHQDIPFEKLVEELAPARDLSRQPLFQVMFALQNTPTEALTPAGLGVTPIDLEGPEAAKFDLTLNLLEQEGALEGTLGYALDLFDAATIERMVERLRLVLEAAIRSPEARVSDWSLLTAKEADALASWNATNAPYPEEACIHELFEAQVDRTPDALAVMFEDEQVTYAELDRRANRFADLLRAQGVGPEARVGLCLPRSVDQIAALLGILKAGGAYVPLDPSYPRERLDYMVQDSGLRWIVARGEPGESLAGQGCALQDFSLLDEASDARIQSGASSSNLAYIIYTSGSTGKPKGVMLTHRGACNLAETQRRLFGLGEGHRVLQFSQAGFDASVFELLLSLPVGGCLVLARAESLQPGDGLASLIEERKIDAALLPPSALAVMSEDKLSRPALLWVGGEACPPEVARRWSRGRRLVNAYGPTEITVCATMFAYEPFEGSLPIGRPLPNMNVYVLDPNLQPAPVGVPGEIYISGVGLARGYAGRHGLTAERFLPDPFSRDPGARMYRTGDHARWRDSGNLDYLGRVDTQIKLRGFRVELGEIEAALSTHPGVRDAVVVARQDRLVAYLVADREPTPTSLREHLGRVLPDYMIPAAFVTLSAFPLSPSGKVDRRALPEPSREHVAGDVSDLGPRTPVEQTLVEAFAEVLRLPRVGVYDDFFALGGHSLLATQLVSRIRASVGIELPLRALFESPTVSGLAERVEVEQRKGGMVLPPIKKSVRDGEPPLSFAQQRLWFLDQLAPGGTTYHMPFALRLSGDLNVEALRKAFEALLHRHEALRTTMESVEGQARQKIHPPGRFDLPFDDLSSHESPESQAYRIGADELMRPFELAAGPLFRARLFRLQENEHILVMVMHHIVSDGWSMGIVMRELLAHYEATCAGRAAILPALSVHYADYAIWQREWLSGEVLERQLAYWREKLSGLAPLELPTDRARPPQPSYRGKSVRISLGKPLTEALHALARRQGVTLFMVLLAGFQSLLHRLSGQTDIAVGTPIAGRTQKELESLIGFFVNTLVLRADFASNPSFLELLGQVKDTTLDAYAHQDVPFEKLVEELAPARDLSRQPLFQAMFALQNTPTEELAPRGLRVKWLDLEGPEAAKFDLTLNLLEQEGALEGTLGYALDLFDAATIERMVERLRAMLEAAVAEPTKRVGVLPLLTSQERQMFVELSGLGAPYPEPSSIHALFEAQVDTTPDALAVLFEDEQVTYAELDRRANRFSHLLGARGVGTGARIGVLLPRSMDAIVALLGILKAGAAYVPLDPKHPNERLEYILRHSGACMLITDDKLSSRLSSTDAPMLFVDRDGAVIASEREDRRGLGSAPESLAYLIYTSGSTGKPKGAAITHRSASIFLQWSHRQFSAADMAGVLWSTSIGFDLSIFEIFAPLTMGGAVIVAEDVLSLHDLPTRERVTLVNTVPSAAAELLRDKDLPASVHAVNLAGEPLPASLARRIYAIPSVERLYNLYGPTEDTTYSTFDLVERDTDSAPTIGRPILGTSAYVLDRNLEPMPPGAVGELYLGGAGLALGYIGRADLTAERFLPDPYARAPGARMYRTGDRARWSRSGKLEYLGRVDTQIKLRGFRIELGEIEAALSAHPSVRDVVVDLRGDRLVGYLVAHAEQAPSTSTLREHLGRVLPDYMIPAAFVTLSALPLSPNGKIDRRALPEPSSEHTAGTAADPGPRTPVEQTLVEAFAEVLRLPRVGVYDDFFALGGHSLLATQLVSRVRSSLGIELPLRALFESPTVSGLAGRVEVEQRKGGMVLPPIKKSGRDGDLPLSFAQQRLWFLDQLVPGSTTYHMPFALRLAGDLDVEALRKAFEALLHRHEALRTTMESVEGQARQKIHPPGRFDLPFDDLSSHESPEVQAYRVGADDLMRPFDLAAGPLLRARLFRLREKEHILVTVMHHIVSDGWSLGIVMRELLAHYEAACAGRAAILPPLSVQYADYAIWQRAWLSGEVLEKQLAYWREKLSGLAPLELPTDRLRPPQPSYRGGSVRVSLGKSLTEALQALARRQGVTLFMVLLAGFQALLHRSSGRTDVAVGTPIAGRTQKELEGLIGFFVNTLVLRTDFTSGPSFWDLLTQVKETTLDAYAHQDIPFEKLVEELAPARDLSRQPLFQVMFVLQNTPTEALTPAGLGVTPIDLEGPEAAKFDLTLNLLEQEGALEGTLGYALDLFDTVTIERMVERLRLVLEAAVRSPEARISDWSLLTAKEADALASWNATNAPYPQEACIHELFEAQVDRTPDALAVVFEDEQVTYAELDRRANRFADLLRAQGVGPEARVGLCLPRSVDQIAALLGILKAGGAYVPLDPSYPRERLDYMVQDSGLRWIVARGELGGSLAGPGVELLDGSQLEGGSVERIQRGARPDNLAYLIYTSGSTGKPKAVAVAHHSVVNLAIALERCVYEGPRAEGARRVALNAPLSFDASVKQWSRLLFGDTLVLLAEEDRLDRDRLLAVLRAQAVDVLDCTPTQLGLLLELGFDGSIVPTLVLVGGEAIEAPMWARLARDQRTNYVNVYGPTECTVDTTALSTRSVAKPALGPPLPNVRAYVLDRNLVPAPVGVPGELYIGGAGLARGYAERPGLTAERFLPDPFSSGPGARMYRTGDRARWLHTGNLEYLGRIDTQIKLRGFRIELGEIEAALSAHPSVRDAVVDLRGDRLIGYIVAHAEQAPSRSTLREHLGRVLPDYMVPTAFVALSALPLSPNGKIDRRALPEPSHEHTPGNVADPGPRTPVEQTLVEAFAEVLRLPRVGVYDDFFALGGHSLLATQLVSRVRSSLGIELPLRALFESPTVSGLAGRVEVEQRKGGMVLPPIQRHGREGELPLSFAQQRLWFLDQLEPGSAAYHMPFALRLSGDLDVEALRKAFEALLHRHESLRTTLETVEGQAWQKIHPPGRFELPFEDLSTHDSPEHHAYRLGAEEALRPFDLASGPLFRARLFQLRANEHVLLTVMHHIVSDGWSMGIVMRELLAYYEAACAGRAAMLPDLSVQYTDYAIWQRKWLLGEVLERQLAYWKEKLSGVAPLELPTDRPRPPQPSHRGGSVRMSLGKELTGALHELARRQGVTLFMVLLAGFQALLHRLSGQADIAVGTPIAGRTQKELESLIGFFVNTLVLRTDFNTNPSFLELLGQVKETTLDAYAHQDLPFEKLVEELSPARDLSRQPFFQVMFALQNTPTVALGPTGLGVRLVDLGGADAAKFDLTLTLMEQEGALEGTLGYASDLFDAETIERMAERLRLVLEAVALSPESRISEWSLLIEQESRLFASWNATEAPYPQESCIPELFEAQVDRTPGASAVVFEDEEVTYAELDRRANRFANLLRAQGVGPEVRVGLCLPRSVDQIAALLGILKAGGAYVPLDPSYPRERLEYMVRDSGLRLLVARGEPGESLAGQGCALLDWPQLDAASEARFPSGVRLDNLAYVIYTSGSTGKPKGAMLAHRSAVNFALALERRVYEPAHLDKPQRVALNARLSFDASVQQWLRLLFGDTLVLLDEQDRLDPDRMLAKLRKQAVDVLDCTPTQLGLLLDRGIGEEGVAARLVLVGGEAIDAPMWARLARDQRTNYVNVYGPTECTVDATALSTRGVARPALGPPLPNVRAYVLERNLLPAPVGVPGELYIGGVGLARGYAERRGLTAERFLPDPFSSEPGARMYRTGDRARWQHTGNLEYLGRVDTQIKLRGFRIELGEIEAALSAHPGVRDAVVDLRGDRLVGYLVANAEQAPSPSALREHLGRVLPDYMIPAAFLTLSALPLSPNGKIDRRALPEPSREHVAGHVPDLGPRTPVEQTLVEAFAEVLRLPSVGVYDDFFALGGHSLLATQLVSRVRSALGVELPLRALFESPTVSGLAGRVEVEQRKGGMVLPPIKKSGRDGELPLSFAQQRLWFLDQLTPGSATYHMPFALRLSGELNVEALRKAFEALLHRHEALRTTIETVEGQARQEIHPPGHFDLPFDDLSSHDSPESRAYRIGAEELMRPFELAAGPLFRARLFRLREKEHILVMVMHHIVSDGWSMGIVMSELLAHYEATCAGRAAILSPLSVQYADYAIWQREWLSGEVLERQLAYWREKLAGVSPIELPTDRPRPPSPSHRGGSVQVSLGKSLTETLQSLARQQGVTLFMVLLAGFQALLHRSSGQTDIAVGTPIAGRTQKELESLIGFFVNTLVLRADFSPNPSFLSLLAQVKETTLDAYAHQDIPFEKLVEELAPARDLSRQPLFQVMFVLQNTPTETLTPAGLGVTPIDLEGPVAAKFDLTLNLMERDGALEGTLGYALDLFDATTIERMVERLRLVLQAAARLPEARVSEWSLLTEQESRLFAQWNATKAPYPQESCMHELFEAQVDRTPDALAVMFEDEQVTYAELDRRANRFAYLLRAQGVGPEARVGLCLPRSVDQIAALLGILKAGGAYVPFDPGYPRERLEYMVRDSGLRLLVARGEPGESLAGHGCDLLDVSLLDAASPARFPSGARPDNVAYVIYTSGSTGKPKGVMLAHRGACNLAEAQRRIFGLAPGARVLQFARLGFDASVSELFTTLTEGATLCLLDGQAQSWGEDLSRFIERRAIEVVTLPPSALSVMQDKGLSALRCLVVAGEACPPELARRWAQGRRLINGYGPTETTVCATTFAYEPFDGSLPIGRPLQNTHVYVLDRNLQPAPVGVPGELYIGGVGLARGYAERHGLTAERFLPDPFSSDPGARMYRTGDRARWLHTGNLEYLGRVDTQIKLRGFRVELGEIEAALSTHPGVRDAVVDLRQDRLVAYLVADPEPTPTSLREYLGRLLMDYMIPTAFVTLSALPLSPNGKIDRRALPEPAIERHPDEPQQSRDRLEFELVAIWEELLGTRGVGLRDDFFALGGHSLLAAKLVARVESQLGRRLPLARLLRGATVEEVAAALREDPADTRSPLVALQPRGSHTPLYCVHAIGGSALSYLELARALGGDQPVYAFHARGLDEGEPESDIETMATHYVEALIEARPEGAVRLLGWSFGGIVAFEMARQLSARGIPVEDLILLDTHLPRHTLDPDDASIALLFAREHGMALSPDHETLLSLASPEERGALLSKLSTEQGIFPAGMAETILRRTLGVYEAHLRALQNYRLQKAAVRMSIIRAARSRAFDGEVAFFADPTGGWSDLVVPAPTLWELPGDHFSLLRAPLVANVAEIVQKCPPPLSPRRSPS